MILKRFLIHYILNVLLPLVFRFAELIDPFRERKAPVLFRTE